MPDNVTLLWHWDEELRLSFKWDCDPSHDIGVEQGGFGEPTVCQLAGVKYTGLFAPTVREFRSICRTYCDKVRNNVMNVPKVESQMPDLHPDFWTDNDIKEAMRGI